MTFRSGRRGIRAGVSVLALVLLLLGATGATAAPQSQAPAGTQELLIGFVPGTAHAQRAAAHALAGGEVLRSFDAIDVDAVRVPEARAAAVRSVYRESAQVLFAEPNSVRTKAVVPNDTNFGQQWGLPDVGAALGWDVTTGADSTIVAVVDSGVDVTHPDLSPNIWRNPGEIAANGVDDDHNGYVDDVNGWDFAHGDASVYDPSDICTDDGLPADDHGTHVAGIIGAVGNNNRGVAGVAWHVRIMPLKFLTRCGNGGDADAIEAIMYAIRMGARVINISWDGPSTSGALRQALLAARDAGVIVAVAAGNNGQNLAATPDYPASYGLPNEVVVVSSDEGGAMSSFSNYGTPAAIAAPGRHILSTLTGGRYEYLSGTSMATPFVTGALALLRSQYPGDTVADLRNRLILTADPKPAFAIPLTSSGGRMNLDTALRAALPTVPTVTSPNGGESLVPGDAANVTWRTNVPDGVPAPAYRVEQTTDPFASKSLSASFDSGEPGWLTQPPDSEGAWARSGTTLRSAVGLGNDQASWATTTVDLSVPGRVRFSYRLSSENCESQQAPDCGDYFSFLVDGAEMIRGAGVLDWRLASFPLSPGRHVLSWAYRKDFVCPAPTGDPACAGAQSLEDAAFVDDLSIEGVDAAAWSTLGTTAAGVSSFAWSPFSPAAAAKVRVCVATGLPCSTAAADQSDATFSIGPAVAPAGVGVGVGSTGYWLVARDGGIFAFGDARFQGSTGGIRLAQPIVAMAPTPSGRGYRLVASDGGIFAFGDATFEGSTGGLELAQPIVGVATTPSGRGYWLVARDGGIFAFGDATFHGSTGGIRLAQPIVAMAPTASGRGYRLVASDGGIFAFGDATFHGSTGGIRLAQPIVGMAATASGGGYWLVARDGGMFAYGDAAFRGSTGGMKLNRPIVSMAPTPTGTGYWLVASDGGIFAFGDAVFLGSTGSTALAQPIVAVAVRGPGL